MSDNALRFAWNVIIQEGDLAKSGGSSFYYPGLETADHEQTEEMREHITSVGINWKKMREPVEASIEGW